MIGIAVEGGVEPFATSLKRSYEDLEVAAVMSHRISKTTAPDILSCDESMLADEP